MKQLIILMFAALFIIQSTHAAAPAPKKSGTTAQSASKVRPGSNTALLNARIPNYKTTTKSQHAANKVQYKLAQSAKSVKKYKQEVKTLSQQLKYAKLSEKTLKSNYQKAQKKLDAILVNGEKGLTPKQQLEAKKYDTKGLAKKLRTATKNRANLELKLSDSQKKLKFHQSQNKKYTAEYRVAKRAVRTERGGLWNKIKNSVDSFFTRTPSKPTVAKSTQPKTKAKGVTFRSFEPPGKKPVRGKVTHRETVSVVLDRLPMAK